MSAENIIVPIVVGIVVAGILQAYFFAVVLSLYMELKSGADQNHQSFGMTRVTTGAPPQFT